MQIDAAGEELTKVVQEYIMLEDDFNERVNEKVLDERKFIKALEQRLEQEKQATENAREDLSKMADDKAEVERLLNDADAKNARYERKEGLEEAVAHQKELKLEIRRRDRELSKVNHKLSEQLEANDLLTETLRRLKVEYNLPPDFEYPDLELREGIRSESERLKALNLMWEEQNSELESERTRLLQALRTQSQLSSEKGFKQFGLVLVLAHGLDERRVHGRRLLLDVGRVTSVRGVDRIALRVVRIDLGEAGIHCPDHRE